MANYDPNVDYQAKINELKKVNPNDPRISVLQEQRQAKENDINNRTFVGVSPNPAPGNPAAPSPVTPKPVKQTQPTIQNPVTSAPVQTTPTQPTANMGITLGNTSIGSAIKKVNQGVNPVTNAPLPQTQPQPVTNPAPVTPSSPQPVTNQSNQQVGVRDFLAAQLGVDASLIGWQPGVNGQPGRVTVNGTPINIQGLNLNNGSSYATPEQIEAAFNPYGGVPFTMQNNDLIISKAQNEYDKATKLQDDVIKLINETPFNETFAAEKKAMWEQSNQKFEYNPETDLALQQAAKLARKNVLATMNARGILNSSITEQGLIDVETTLIPEYRKIAFDEYNQQISNALQKLNVLQGITEFDYQKYRDWVTQNLEIAGVKVESAEKNLNNMYKIVDEKRTAEIQKINLRKTAIEEATNRTNLNGYATNQDAVILGVKPGTLSEEAQKRSAELKQYAEKQKLDLEYQKKIADMEHRYTMSEISARQETTKENAAQKAATDVNKVVAKATPQQKQMYDNYMQIFYATPGNDYYQNPDRVYQRLIGRPDIAEDVGNELYYAMIKQAETSALKIGTVTPKIDTATTFTVDDYSTAIDKQFSKRVTDDDTKEVSVVYDLEGIRNYLNQLSDANVDERITNSLALKYGLVIGE